jgi:hypothetical protein
VAQTLLEEILAALGGMPEEERKAVVAESVAATAGEVWVPNVGPQTEAYFCEADELFYGGQAGGGKSDLLIGVALNEQTDSLILRRLSDDAKDLAKRGRAVAGPEAGFNGQDKILTLGERQVRFGGCQLEEDKERYKGRAKDFYGFDEIGDFTKSQFKFITTWNRSTKEGQRCRVICAGNPPTRPEGLWIIQYWGAWLDENHPRPAKPGELRWYTTGPDGEDMEVEGRGPHTVNGEQVYARSRTFIPAKLSDNPYLANTNYRASLDALPPELRSAYRDGVFKAELKDDDYQVLPTAWIDAAMKRWTPQRPMQFSMTAMAVDVAPGGIDQMVLSTRYGGWFSPLVAKRQVDKDGNVVAGLVAQHRRDACPVVVDVGGGWGGDAVIALKGNQVNVVAYLGVGPSNAKTRDGRLTFYNKRAETIWRFREALDPGQDGGSTVALPPDPELKADLASYRWHLRPTGIIIESKEEIKSRIGRSPDKGDAVTMCLSEGNAAVKRELQANAGLPATANVGHSHLKNRRR